MTSRYLELILASCFAGLLLISITASPALADGSITATFIPDVTKPGVGTLSMQPGSSSGSTFNIEIRVTGIDDFFGVAFQVEFDPTLAIFVGFDATGSFIAADGAPTIALAQESAPGVVVCGATILGANNAGVDAPGPPGAALLMTLTFNALVPTAGTAYQFGPPGTRAVTICPTAGGTCSELPDGDLTWAGGTLVNSVIAVPAASASSIVLLGAALLGLQRLVSDRRCSIGG